MTPATGAPGVIGSGAMGEGPSSGERTGASDGAPAPRLRVLVVDDEAPLLRAYARILAAHEVVTAKAGREAVALLAADPAFDVIVCDLTMPDLDGVGVYEAVTAAAPALARRFVFCSGGSQSSATTSFLEQHGHATLGKPFARGDLTEIVARVAAAAR